MTFAEAKNLILHGISTDIAARTAPVMVEGSPPNEPDEAKFLINGKLAHLVSFFSGWHVPINLKWFSGSYDQPQIQGSAFYWYAFAIPTLGRLKNHTISSATIFRCVIGFSNSRRLWAETIGITIVGGLTSWSTEAKATRHKPISDGVTSQRGSGCICQELFSWTTSRLSPISKYWREWVRK